MIIMYTVSETLNTDGLAKDDSYKKSGGRTEKALSFLSVSGRWSTWCLVPLTEIAVMLVLGLSVWERAVALLLTVVVAHSGLG